MTPAVQERGLLGTAEFGLPGCESSLHRARGPVLEGQGGDKDREDGPGQRHLGANSRGRGKGGLWARGTPRAGAAPGLLGISQPQTLPLDLGLVRSGSRSAISWPLQCLLSF